MFYKEHEVWCILCKWNNKSYILRWIREITVNKVMLIHYLLFYSTVNILVIHKYKYLIMFVFQVSMLDGLKLNSLIKHFTTNSGGAMF